MADNTELNEKELERLSAFEISGNMFGIEITKLAEVINLPPSTPLPNGNEIYQGVFNLRGEIYPLVDISPILGLRSKQIKQDDMVVLVNHFDIIFGVLADRIHGIVTYPKKNVKNAAGIVSHSLHQFVQEVLEQQGQFIHILNLERLFRAPRLLAYF